MTDTRSHPPDICLLLRAHGEQRWLTSEVVPVLRQLEQPGAIPEDQLGAALAYLEVLWIDARMRAAETDAAYAKLQATAPQRRPPAAREGAPLPRRRAPPARAPIASASPRSTRSRDARRRSSSTRPLSRSHTLRALAPRFDLQSHSTHSDGALSAEEVVTRAADAGVELLALSDHDTVSGVSEAIAAGERFGVRVVSAVEISAVDDGSPVPRELHILGYNIDHTGRTAHRATRRVPRRPRAPHAAHARRRCARSASSSTKPRSTSASPPANRSAARTSPKPCCGAPPTPSGSPRRTSTTSAR